MKVQPRIQIVGRLPRDLRKALGAFARAKNVSMNTVLAEALTAYLATPQPRRAPERAVRRPLETKERP